MSPPPIRKSTLGNGLRVVLAPDPRVPRVALAVHYGVGFRSELPGRDGFAHLFEHLMFRGSESLPAGRFYEHLHRWGGEANGTTHQDYTDYYQVVPAAALEQALFSEADRMRAPAFTPEAVAEQLDAVESEIHAMVVEPPYGGFPWPLLPAVLYESYANAHDGYGRVEVLRQTTPDDCAAFFDAHYTPSNAVLTVAGGFDADEAAALVERHFADVPPREAPVPPDLDESPPGDDRWVTCARPAATLEALAVGYRLPDPARELDAYLACLVAAKLLERQRLLAPTPVAVSSSCGFFGPLDARAPDTLVVTSLLPPGIEGRDVVEALDSWWVQVSGGGLAGSIVADTAALLAAEHRRVHADLTQRARALGRLELLFGRAEMVDELADAIAGVGAEGLAETARRVGSAGKAVLLIAPGEEQAATPAASPSASRPGGAPLDHAGSPRAEDLARTASGPRPVPAAGRPVSPPRARWEEAATPEGMRVVGVRDERAGTVEVRLRVPLGSAVWAVAGAADRLVGALRSKTLAPQRAMAVGGNLQVETDGQWLDIAGFAVRERLDEWLDVLAGVVTASGLDSSPAVAPPAMPEPPRLADDALRRWWVGGRNPAAGPDGSAPAGLRVPGPAGGALVLVGDIDPSRLPGRIADLSAAWAASSAPLEAVPDPPSPGVVRLDAVGPVASAALSALEPSKGPHEAARYLATAVYGAYIGSRLLQRTTASQVHGYAALAGRDVLLDRARIVIRASVPEHEAARMVADLEGLLADVQARPATPVEVERAREYCIGQMLSVHDSPQTTADALRVLVASGRVPDWLSEAPRALAAVSADDVTAAGRMLFVRPTWGVTLGDIDLAGVVGPA